MEIFLIIIAVMGIYIPIGVILAGLLEVCGYRNVLVACLLLWPAVLLTIGITELRDFIRKRNKE